MEDIRHAEKTITINGAFPEISVRGNMVVMRRTYAIGTLLGSDASGTECIITSEMDPEAARHLAKQLNFCADAAEV